MSAEAACAVRTWSVGRYTCTITLQRPRRGAVLNAAAEWAPEQPSRLSDSELAEYRRGRNQALAEISRELGINAAVVDL